MWSETEVEDDVIMKGPVGAPVRSIWEDPGWWHPTNLPQVRSIEWKTRIDVWDHGFVNFLESVTKERWATLNCHGRAYVFIAVLVAAVQFSEDLKDDPKYWPTIVDVFARFGERVWGECSLYSILLVS